MVVKIEEIPEENKVLVYLPRCSKCNESMVKFFYKYRADDRLQYKDRLLNEVTFGYENLVTEMIFACEKHRDQRVIMTPEELGKLASYMHHQIKYVRTPKSPTVERLTKTS